MLTRRTFAASLVLLAIVAAPLAYAQNPPNPTRGGPGGPGGPGGGGPGGGPGGFGGPGGWGGRGNGPANDSAERLLQIDAVQEDLKIDDKAKAKITSLGEAAVKQRTKTRDTITKQAQAMAAQAAAQQNALMAEQLAQAGINVDPKALNTNNGGGGRGGRGGNRQIEMQMMNLAMASLQNDIDAKMIKLLSKPQKERLKQIQLQQEGSRAFTTPNQEVVAKLGLTPEQLEAINSANRELQGTQWQAMQDVMATIVPPDNNGGGGRGGRGGFMNMQNLDDVTRAKVTTAMTDLQAKNTAATMAAIGKILTKGQKTKYDAMIGAPFDVALLRGPGPGGPGGPGRPGAPATATAPTTPATGDAAKSTTGATRKGGVASQRGDN